MTAITNDAKVAAKGLEAWKIACGAIMVYVIYGAFFVAGGAKGFTVGGDGARIIFFHVPSAVLSSVMYAVSMYYALMYLVGKKAGQLDVDMKSAIAMELGALHCLLATISGSIFAGIQWGAFWNWDPRETSIVVMLLIYCAYLVLRGAMGEKPIARARISAVYALIALVPAQFLIWAVPRLLDGNHPTTTLRDPAMTSLGYKLVLYPSFIAFIMVTVWLFQLRFRAYRLTASREENL
jgi:heme exporter protein C